MSERKRILILVLIMATACVAVAGTTIAVLYHTAFEEEREVLKATAHSWARLIESVARFDAVFSQDFPGGSEAATLKQIMEAHGDYKGVGETGEFSLAKRRGDKIVFLLRHRHDDFDTPEPVPMDSKLAEPMRRALSGLSGTMIGPDYRGERVLAAYESIDGLGWGVVVKMDIAELRAPFLRAGALAVGVAVALILLGARLFIGITNPIIRSLSEHAGRLSTLVASLRQSEEKLQKAREDLEIRVQQRTAELVEANKRMEVEVRERAQAEERLRALWKIAEMVDSEDRELYDHILKGALQMTRSKFAFYGFMNADESVMSIHSWSKDVYAECRMRERPIDYPIAKAGIWAEAVRKKQVLVVNDYRAEHPAKLGLPEGHVPLTRILVVPVFSRGRIVAVVAGANKESPYSNEDVKQLEAFVSGVQVIIEQRKTEKELRESEKECRLLSRQVIEALENEKKRFAREIHDGVGQSLAAVKFRAEHYSRSNREDTEAKSNELNSIIQMIQSSIEEVRKIQNDLRPAYIDELGLLATLSGFCAGFQETYWGIRVKTRIEISEQDMPEYLKAPVYRIFQEAMNNAAKHSSASRIDVFLRKEADSIELAVEDNGVGFISEPLPSENTYSKGMGLSSMKERAELSGGHLEIISAPGKGTTIRASWAIDNGS
jgi:signal transduction histidine kinase